MNELHLFAGAGGGILGGMLLGHTCVCAVEIEPYCRKVLLQRQRDGILPKFPIWDDVRTFDGRPWRGRVDVVCGGFPCQDISGARINGNGGGGIGGSRSGLWKQMLRVICEVGPSLAFVENSPLLTSRGIDVVLSDLAELGFDAEWGVLGAEHAGAPHCRHRIWIVAHSNTHGKRLEAGSVQTPIFMETVSRGNGRRFAKVGVPDIWLGERPIAAANGRMADGMADRLDRLAAIGNGQVPAVAKLAWETLTVDL